MILKILESKVKKVSKVILNKEKTVLLDNLPSNIKFHGEPIMITPSITVIDKNGFNTEAAFELIIESGDAVFANGKKEMGIMYWSMYDHDLTVSITILGVGNIKIRAEEI